MKQGNNNRRGRGRGPRKPHGIGQHNTTMTKTNQTYDSNGPDIRVRGNAHQVLEKYLQMARDAGSAGDRVAAENYLQHAEHYYRMISAQTEGQRPRVGGRDLSVADVNVQNVSQGLSAALYATAGTSGALPEGDMSEDGDPDQPEAQPLANGNYVPQSEGNGRSNSYGAGRSRDNGSRGNGGRDNSRDNGNRDNGNRESGRESSGRDNGGRESGNRDTGGRDNGAREYSNRDGAVRETNSSEVAPPPRRPSRAPAVTVDEQPDYPAELLPAAPAAPIPVETQPSLALVQANGAPANGVSVNEAPANVAPVDGAPAGDGADGTGNAPRRGRGRPRGSTNRRTPRNAAAAGDTTEPAAPAVPVEPGE